MLAVKISMTAVRNNHPCTNVLHFHCISKLVLSFFHIFFEHKAHLFSG